MTPTLAGQPPTLVARLEFYALTLSSQIGGLLRDIQLTSRSADIFDDYYQTLIEDTQKSADDASANEAITRAKLQHLKEVIQNLEAQRVMSPIWTASETEQSAQLQPAIQANTEEVWSSNPASHNANGVALAERTQLHRSSPLFNVNASSADLEVRLEQAHSQYTCMQEQLTRAHQTSTDLYRHLEDLKLEQKARDSIKPQLDGIDKAANYLAAHASFLATHVAQILASSPSGLDIVNANPKKFQKITDSFADISKKVAGLDQQLNEWCGKVLRPPSVVKSSATDLDAGMDDENHHAHIDDTSAHGNADARPTTEGSDPEVDCTVEVKNIGSPDQMADNH